MANSRVCSIPGCSKPVRVKSRSWCNAHYQRWCNHGDPLGGGTMLGDPLRYLREVVRTTVSDECLYWPYATNWKGYGHIWLDGRTQFVHRIVCEELNGPPPTSIHQAAHNCGKGRFGCVNPRHMAWKTPLENTSDKVLHGTNNQGERHPSAKLTEANVRKILKIGRSEPQTKLAKAFGVHKATINQIICRRIWGHIVL